MDLSFEIKIVFDNKCPKPGFLPGFGFSALMYNHFTGNYSLFDTGGNGNTLIHNIKQFNIDISDIKKVVISHNHHDHAGGLARLLQHNRNLEIFIPINYLQPYLRRFTQTKIHGVSEIKEIEKNLNTLGQFNKNSLSEQCLCLKTSDEELILIVGCAHPGLEKFIIKAQEIGKIKAIIGGFHSFNKYSYLEEIDFIGPCHCTQHINMMKEKFSKQFNRICLGDNISF